MEERLLIEAARRDPSRFGELYDEHFHRVYVFVARKVATRADAEDITAEVFRHALGAIKEFEWRGVPFAAWLYRIAANEIADYYAKRTREMEKQFAEPTKSEEVEIEQRASLYRSVDRLPPDQRRVIVMRFAEGKSIREIAEDLGRSEGAVKQLQWRALQTLRAKMSNA